MATYDSRTPCSSCGKLTSMYTCNTCAYKKMWNDINERDARKRKADRERMLLDQQRRKRQEEKKRATENLIRKKKKVQNTTSSRSKSSSDSWFTPKKKNNAKSNSNSGWGFFLFLFLVGTCMGNVGNSNSSKSNNNSTTAKKSPSKIVVGQWGTVITKQSDLLLREKPYLNAKSKLGIPKSSRLWCEFCSRKDFVYGKKGRWCYVNYKGQTGYVWGWYVDLDK